MPIGDRGTEHVQDLQRALEARGLLAVLGGDAQAGHEVPDGHERHVRLAQRRQNTADVVQERRGWPDHQHAVAFDPLALGVEQVGDAVQRHHRLPGARAAFDHQNPGVIEPDDLVLLGLDGRDDVAHALPARCVDRRQQRRIPALIGTGSAEDLVGEIDDPPSEGVELPTPTHVLRGRGGGHIERARRRCPPIEQQWFVLVVRIEDADAADVQTLVCHAVQPAETQSAVGDVQPRDLFGQCAHRDVACHECAAVHTVDGTAHRGAVPVLHARAFSVEPHVEPIHVALLGPQFVVVLS